MTHFTRTLMTTCAVAGLLAAAPAFARTTEAQAQYAKERAACVNGTSNQDRATCLKEAGAALAEARRGQVATAPADGEFEKNRLLRCDAQRGADREDCIARMQDGTRSGSAQGGGILREVSRPDSMK